MDSATFDTRYSTACTGEIYCDLCPSDGICLWGPESAYLLAKYDFMSSSETDAIVYEASNNNFGAYKGDSLGMNDNWPYYVPE